MKKTILLSILLLVTTINIFAQSIPNQFKYQAVLRDASGELLINESVDLDIVLLQGSPTGTIVFTENHNLTTTTQGLINLNIGSINDLSMVEWATDTYFVEISINGVVMGTSQLLSVPYALHANTVENDAVDDADADPTNELQNLTDSNLTGTSLEISIENGTSTTIDLSSLQDGTGTDDQNLTGAILTGTNLEISIENGTSTTVDLSSLQDGSGTDDQELTLTGNTLNIENGNNVNFTGWDTDVNDDFDGDYNSLDNQPTIPSSVSDLSDINTTGVTNGQILQFNGTQWIPNNTIWNKSGSNLYYNTGFVGIGTTNPLRLLHLAGNLALIRYEDTDNNVIFDEGISSNGTTWSIYDKTHEKPRLLINTLTGNVGIGTSTSTPIAKLQTLTTSGSQPTAYFGTLSTNGQSTVLEVVAGGNSNPINLLHIVDSTGGAPNLLKIDGPFAKEFIIKNNGNVGIGTINPTAKLDVNSGLNDLALQLESTDQYTDITMKDNSTTDLGIRLSSIANNLILQRGGGNVGVGINVPNAKFHVDNSDNSTPWSTLISTGNNSGFLVDGHESIPLGNRVMQVSNGEANTTMVVLGNGNMGLGTIHPNNKLSIDLNGQNGKGIQFNNSGANLGHIIFGLGGSMALNSSLDYRFEINNTERMRITNNGNIGIGTTTPQAPLHINDFMKLEPRSTAPPSPTKGTIYYDDTDDKLKVYTGSSWENLN